MRGERTTWRREGREQRGEEWEHRREERGRTTWRREGREQREELAERRTRRKEGW